MLSVRLPAAVERDLIRLCATRQLTKTQVVQEALAAYLAQSRNGQQPDTCLAADLPFLASDDPVRPFIGTLKDGPSTDEWMVITRGDDWNRP